MFARSRFILLAAVVLAAGPLSLVRGQIPGSVVEFRQPPTTLTLQPTPADSGPTLETPAGQAEQPTQARPSKAVGKAGGIRAASMQTPAAQPDPISTPTPAVSQPFDQGSDPWMMGDGEYDGAGAPSCGPSCGCGAVCGCGPNSWTIPPPCDNGWGCRWIGCGTGYQPRNPIYIQAEYLAWWVKGDSLPPLVTTSPTGTSQADAGVLGQPGTSTLYGGNAVNGQMRSGIRAAVGYWLAPTTRAELDFFWLGTANANFSDSSSTNPILARPFFNVSTGAQDSNILAYPGVSTGSISVSESSSFLGAGASLIRNLCCMDYCCDSQYRLDFLYGFRYLRLAENLQINDSLTSIATVAPAGTVISKYDGFKTSNNFYGFNFGLISERRTARWSWTTIGKIALGGTGQQTVISGHTNTTPPGGATTSTSGGLLALPSNIGSFTHGAFGFVPQLELKLGYFVTPNLRLSVGYDILWWSEVLRPGSQVNTGLNTTQLPPGPQVGPTAPLYSAQEHGLWVQGISLGGDLKF